MRFHVFTAARRVQVFYPVWARSKPPTSGEDISTSPKATHHCLGCHHDLYAEVSSRSFAVIRWFRGLCKQGSPELLFWGPPVSDALAMEGVAAPGLASSRPLSSTCLSDPIYCPLHISLILGIAQDQVLLPTG